tara:strand:- start:1615 stop:2211 length:597 start_codon:yes stop_codon:yes gene_type:complete
MPLMWTNGTTSKVERGPGILWQEGYSTSAVSHVDIVYNDARTAGFDRYTIEIYDLECNGYHPLLTPLKSSGTVEAGGCYGGYEIYGEGGVGTTGANFNNRRGFPISGLRAGTELGNYKGHYTFHISDPVTPTNTGSAYPNVWWHGTHRVSGTLATRCAGGGVNNKFNSHYGIRLETNDTSNARITEYGFALYVYRDNN